jgi:hypothetical protein
VLGGIVQRFFKNIILRVFFVNQCHNEVIRIATIQRAIAGGSDERTLL